MTDYTKTSGMPSRGAQESAARELRLIIAEREERIRKGTSPAGGVDRLRAVKLALGCVEYLGAITYHETNGTPISPACAG